MVRDLVGVGCSAGGLPPLRRLVAGLPATLDASVLVVRHVPARGSTGGLAGILSRDCALDVHYAVDREELKAGQIVIAPPDRHMVVRGSEVRLVDGPRINRV